MAPISWHELLYLWVCYYTGVGAGPKKHCWWALKTIFQTMCINYIGYLCALNRNLLRSVYHLSITVNAGEDCSNLDECINENER
jgi:hypothetical protein